MNTDDGLQARKRWVLKKRRRMFRNLMRILDAQVARMAADEMRRRRRRREPPPPDFQMFEDFKRTMMPLVAELAKLAGIDHKPFLELARPSSTRRRKPAGTL
jgi:hypothetical protein